MTRACESEKPIVADKPARVAAEPVGIGTHGALSSVRPLRITVLLGGPSAEREVSLHSGQAVADALAALGHEVRRADIAPDKLDALNAVTDVVFIALHGTFGEDGQLQRILEQRAIPFCGSGAAASELAMDKVASKHRFRELGVPTPRFDVLEPGTVDAVLGRWTGSAVVKPAAQGSSVGCHIIRDAATLRTEAATLVEKFGRCLVEEYVAGPELTVGILGRETLPPIEIRTHRGFYDYEAKYQDDATEYLFDSGLPEGLLDDVRRWSLLAFEGLGCRDFGRVDWMISPDRSSALALEVNTIPGFTDHSLLPKAAAHTGIEFAELCQRIVDLALRRNPPAF